jgi:hypothetical protein
LVVFWCVYGICSCKGGADPVIERGGGSARSGSAGPAAPPPPPPPPPPLTCADLPGASRTTLQLSSDGKVIYYIEQVRKTLDGGDAVSFDLYSFDLSRRTAKLVVADVSADASVAADGTVVFSRATAKPDSSGRPRRLIMIVPPGKEAVAITGDLDGLRNLAIDRETNTIVFEHRNDIRQELWKVPVVGGKPVRISSSLHYMMVGVAEKSVLVTNFHRLARQPIAGGPMVDLADMDASYFVGVFRDQLVLLGKTDRKLSLAPLAALAKPTALALGTERLTIARNGDQTYVIAKTKDAYEVHSLADSVAKPILVTRGVRPRDVVQVGGQLVMLMFVDSDDDGELGDDDETDLCFAAPGSDPIDVPGRTMPKQFVGIAGQITALTRTGPLAGAKLRFITDRTVEFAMATVPANTAGDDLRALVKQTQDQVTQLLISRPGAPQPVHLSVVISARDTGQRAVSRWDNGAGEFLVTSGVGTAQVADRSQYSIEGNPAVTYERSPFGNEIGEATCSGTVKNISDHELSDLEVACSEHPLDDRHPVRIKLRPGKLAPGATGSYRFGIGYGGIWAHLGLFVFSAGKRLPYFNAYGDKRVAQIIAAATKVHASTGLAYWSMFSDMVGPSYLTKVLKIYVRAPKALEDAPAAELQRAAAKALSQFVAGVPSDQRLVGVPRLLILRDDDRHVGWTYANGKLTETTPGAD